MSNPEGPNTLQVLVGVSVQIVNLLLFFLIFKLLFAKKIVKAFEDRKKLIKEIENADQVCDQKIKEAKIAADKIIKEGTELKEKIVAEGGVLANKRKTEILQEAKIKSEEIIKDVELKSKELENKLKSSFEDSVKQTSFHVLKKLFKKDQNIEKNYLDNLVTEVINEKN